MRRVWVSSHGGPDVLEVREENDPEPGLEEVRVRVEICGINFADILGRMGLYPDAPKPPCVLGYEVAGVIDRLGPGVSNRRVGERVLALTPFGGYSDTVVIPEAYAISLPDSVSLEMGAALGVPSLTAWILLREQANLREGQTLLVHGLGGGVGLAALQIAKSLGARVFGSAGRDKHSRVLDHGAEGVYDPKDRSLESAHAEWTNNRGFDVILDPLGGRSFQASYRALAPLGKLCVFGVSSFAPSQKRRLWPALKGLISMPRFHPIKLMNENRSVMGVHVGHLWDEGEKVRRILEELLNLTDGGTLSPVIDQKFSFQQAGEAHRYIQSRKSFGRVLLVP